MRKHRIYGVVIASLLGTGALVSQPTSTSSHPVPGVDLTGADVNLPPSLPGGTHPSLLQASDLPEGLINPAATPQTGDTGIALVSLLAPTPTPPPPPPPPPPPQPVVTPVRTSSGSSSSSSSASSSTPVTGGSSAAGGVWQALRDCESGGNYAENTGNGFYGAYQFTLSTWEGLGYSGLPSNAPPAEQDAAAQKLQARSGWGQWPACAAHLGLT